MTPAMRQALVLFPANDRGLAFARASLTSDNMPAMVAAFNRLMAVQRHQLTFEEAHTPYPPRPLPLHVCLLREEADEAAAASTPVELIDAYLDAIYVALGGLWTLGLQPTDILELFAEVHASNMTKLDENAKPIINGISDGYLPEQAIARHEAGLDGYRSDLPTGKVLKSPDHEPPRLSDLLARILPSSKVAD